MVIDMMMIVMEAGMKTEMVMVMEEKENMAIEMMIGMVVMVIVIAEIMRNAIAEMVTGMMTTGVEVQVLMITDMAREAGVLIGTVMMMMANILLGILL